MYLLFYAAVKIFWNKKFVGWINDGIFYKELSLHSEVHFVLIKGYTDDW